MPQPATRRHAPNARHAARRRPWRRILTALAVTVVLLLGVGSVSAFVAYQRLNSNITNTPIDTLLGTNRPEKVVQPDKPQQPLNILIMGSDKRSGVNAAQTPGERSDTTILLHIAADRQTATAVSIPRDTVVDIPECPRTDGTTEPARTADLFNSAFSEAGAACTVKTVETITDIRIDNYVVVRFQGFRSMVNALGGVKVCLPKAVNDPDSHLVLSAGTHLVKGDQALAYVRTRHSLGDGSDLSRIERQQAFISSMIARVKDKGLLLQPVKLYNFLSAATRSLTTDIGGLSGMTSLAQDVRGVQTKNIDFITAPNETYPPDPNRVQLKASATAVWEALRLDQPLPGRARTTAGSSSSPKPSPTPTPSGPPLVTAPDQVKVQVLDGTGSGTTTEATRVGDALAAAGFQVVGVGTADQVASTTTVRHDPAYDESGRTLGAALPGSTVTSDLSLGATLVVTVGTDSPKVQDVTAGSASTTSPSPSESITARTADQSICS